MPRRKINYPMVKKYILALGKIVPDETEFQEFVKVLCTLLHESWVVRFSKHETHKLMTNYCSRVLKNNGFKLKKKHVSETYFIGGKRFIRRTSPHFIYRTQEE